MLLIFSFFAKGFIDRSFFQLSIFFVFAVLLRFTDYHFGIFKLVLQIYKVYIIPQYITIYNTFISVGAQITTIDYDVVQYDPYETIEV